MKLIQWAAMVFIFSAIFWFLGCFVIWHNPFNFIINDEIMIFVRVFFILICVVSAWAVAEQH